MENNSQKIQDSDLVIEHLLKIEIILSLSIKSIGLVANLLMFVVYFHGSLPKLSVSIYFRCQAVCAALQSLYQLGAFFLNLSFANLNYVQCKLVDFLLNLSCPVWTWFQVVASLDRFLTVSDPTRYKFMTSLLARRIVTASVVAYNVAYNSFILTETPNPNSRDLFICQARPGDNFGLMDFVNESAIPVVLMGLVSVGMFLSILKSRRQLQPDLLSRQTRIRDVKFAIMMIVLNLLFLVSVIPNRLNNLVGINHFSYGYYWVIFSALVADLNDFCVSNVFWVHLVANRFVRRELGRIVERGARFLKTNISNSR